MSKKYVASVRVRKPDLNGNTYHDITLLDATSGEEITHLQKVYGYGNQYTQTALGYIRDFVDADVTQSDFIFVAHKY